MLPAYIIEELERRIRERELAEECLAELPEPAASVELDPEETSPEQSSDRGVAFVDFTI